MAEDKRQVEDGRSLRSRKIVLLLLTGGLFVASGWLMYGYYAHDRNELPPDAMQVLERRTAQCRCESCGETISLPALEFMAKTSPVHLLGRTICDACQEKLVAVNEASGESVATP